MTLEEVIDKFLDSSAHIFLDNGVYVDRDYDLIFNKEEHHKLFWNGYYKPDYKEWLLTNSKLRVK